MSLNRKRPESKQRRCGFDILRVEEAPHGTLFAFLRWLFVQAKDQSNSVLGFDELSDSAQQHQ